MAQFTQLFLCIATLHPGFVSASVLTGSSSGSDTADSKGHPVAALFAEQILADNSAIASIRASSLPEAERFDALRRWVLPSEARSTFRMNGKFTQTDPAPLIPMIDDGANVQGGRLVSPVFDLLYVATQTGQLQGLLESVKGLPFAADEKQERARLAMLVLIHLELKQQDAAAAALQQLLSLVKQDVPAGMDDQWPETLVVYRAIDHFGDHGIANDLIAYLYTQRAQRELPKGFRTWHNQISSLAGQQSYLAAGSRLEDLAASAGLSQWVAVSRTRATTRGDGNPPTYWRWQSERVDNVSAHNDEYLFFRSPLLGNYEVECDLTLPSVARGQVMMAGTFVGPHYDRRQLEVGTFRTGGVFEPIGFQLGQFDQWVHFRAVVRENECRTYINGQQVRTSRLVQHSDPWVAIRSWGRSHGGVRDLRITGSPVIPASVDLSASSELTGWIPYYDETIAREGAGWQHLEDRDSSGMILGRRAVGLAGTFAESLLRYQRPLEDTGAVEYDFFYTPGSNETHPALDRLAFLLQHDGVRLHWITDSPLDQSQFAPDNLMDEPASRPGPGEIPLRPDAWNHVTLSVTGSLVSLRLNGQLVFERTLEASNLRTFGFFHYADNSEVRVRNVTMRGQWPKSLPPVSEQELARPLTNQLDAELTKLNSVFRHDFKTDGLPPEFFTTSDSDQRGSQSAGVDGAVVYRPTTGNWSTGDIRLPFILHGDFDVEAAFDQLLVSGDKDGCIMLDIHLDDEKQHELRLMRIRNSTQRQLVQVSLSSVHQDGSRSYNTRVQSSCEAFQGRFRVARRGDKVHFLFAENDSATWQIVGSESVSTRPSQSPGVYLRTLGNGVGEIRVAWTDVTVRAERLTYIPVGNTPQRSLYMMNSGGTDLQLVTRPSLGFTHLGSTEWSRDSRQLICDMSMGGIDTSHVVLMNVDGSDVRDLGPGCMPSLSPDGKDVVLSQPGNSIVRMKSDGSDRKTIENNGWGTQWSPDGRFIAWGAGSQIILLDTLSNERRELLSAEQASMLGSVYWNLGWSHDSKWIAFKGRRNNANNGMVIVASVESKDGFKILYEGPNRVNEDFTWHPDNMHVVFATRVPPNSKLKLAKISRENPGTVEILPGQPTDWDMLDCDWSPDGKRIVFAAQLPPEPVEWTGPLAGTPR